MQYPGEVLVVLDSEGRLVSFRAIPPSEQSPPESVHALDWTDFFSEAEVDMSQWKQVESRFKPFTYADSRTAWQGSLPNWPDMPAWIEAASLQEKPISFEVMEPWSLEAKSKPPQSPMRARVQAIGEGLILIPAILAGIFFARRNLRLGRGDRTRARRLGLFALVMMLAAWLLSIPRSAGAGLLFFPYVAGLIWILYIAIEPFVRRRWPQVLVSWTRLLSGDWRDPRVARDALLGCALGVLINCILRFADLLVPVRRPALLDFEALMGVRYFVAEFLGSLIINPLLWGLGVMCFLFLLTIILRNQKAAFAAFILISPWVMWTGDAWSLATSLVNGILYLFVLMRFGLLSIVVGLMVGVISVSFPASLDVSAWYAGYGYAALALFTAIVIYAFRTSLGGRPLIAAPQIDD
jgi:serine/threonine-protein kinase